MADGRQLLIETDSWLQRLFHDLERTDFVKLPEAGIDGDHVCTHMLLGDVGKRLLHIEGVHGIVQRSVNMNVPLSLQLLEKLTANHRS